MGTISYYSKNVTYCLFVAKFPHIETREKSKMPEAGRALLSIWISTQAVQTHSRNVVRAEESTHLQCNPGNLGVAQLRKKKLQLNSQQPPPSFPPIEIVLRMLLRNMGRVFKLQEFA